MSIWPETKDVVDRLLAAGLARDKFTVRTTFNRRTGQYHKPRIRIQGLSNSEVEVLIPALVAQGFEVVRLVYKGKLECLFVKETGRGGRLVNWYVEADGREWQEVA